MFGVTRWRVPVTSARHLPAWQSDKRWANRFLVEIKGILGIYLIGEAPVEEDAERNSDLMVLTLAPVRVACRVRKYSYYLNPEYRDQFTIRVGRPSGAKTELTKVIEGWGDYFFYGFSDEVEQRLKAWVLGDLKVFRLWFNRRLYENNGKLPGVGKNNSDNSSTFRAFIIADLPDEFVIARAIEAER
mgnify:CR=1 FL=1